MSDRLLTGLNPEQREAVTLGHESALILAGAGSGKTRVLTTRIAWLLQTGQASPAGIAAVTFTNKAAREMVERLSAMLAFGVRGMFVGTFHGLCHRLLRLHFEAAGLPRTFQILDVADQLSVIKRLLKARAISEEQLAPRKLAQFISAHKEAGRRAAAVAAPDHATQQMKELYAEYDAQCQRDGLVDFAELMLRSVELLRNDAALRAHYQQRFSDLLVDEFQDTSSLQYEWLRLLAGPAAAVFAVGDDDQSIYAWRGADTGNMRQLERDFSARIIRLERNYRSHANILECANGLIRNNSDRLGKNLWTEDEAGEPIRVYQGLTDREEAQYVVDEVKALHRQGARLADMAVLYRSNAQSRVMEHALFQAGLPYRVYGGLRFFERQEVRHAMAYLRLIANPEEDPSFLRVVNFPPRGIGARTIEQVQDAATAIGCSLFAAARAGVLEPRAQAAAGRFVQLIESLRQDAAGQPLPSQLELALARSGLMAFYEAENDAEERCENLRELMSAAVAFANENADDDPAMEPLSAFIAHAALEAGDYAATDGQDALQLMTAHAAKGLEFHAVFVTGLEEGLFPHDNAAYSPAGIEEERRLMYVAITRARRRLYLTYASSRLLYNQPRFGVPSRFIDELPQERLKYLNVVPKAAPAARPAARPAATGVPVAGPAPAAGSFRPQQNVIHPVFGVGKVLAVEGNAPDQRVQVRFRNGEVKWLAAKIARLTPM